MWVTPSLGSPKLSPGSLHGKVPEDLSGDGAGTHAVSSRGAQNGRSWRSAGHGDGGLGQLLCHSQEES
jgi:hypothetical protein